jgi:hypothetical protein
LDGIVDSASFSDVGMGTGSGKGGRANVMNSVGCMWKPSEKGSGSRIAGKSAIHARLMNKRDGWPGLIVTRNCVNTIRSLPALTYSKTTPGQLRRRDILASCDASEKLSRLRDGSRRLLNAVTLSWSEERFSSHIA